MKRRTFLAIAATALLLLGRHLWAQQTAVIQLSILVSHDVELDWTSPDGADDYAYNVYRAPGVVGPWTKLTAGPINQLDYMDINVVAGATYVYYVTSISASGAESGPSNMVSCMIPF